MISPLIIPKDEFTPHIEFNPEKNIFLIEGVSRPENVKEFYAPAINWIIAFEGELYKDKEIEKSHKFNIAFKFMYFNSASAKMVFLILESFNRLRKTGFDINIDWYYEDEDDQMHDDGIELSESLNFPFNFHAI